MKRKAHHPSITFFTMILITAAAFVWPASDRENNTTRFRTQISSGPATTDPPIIVAQGRCYNGRCY